MWQYLDNYLETKLSGDKAKPDWPWTKPLALSKRPPITTCLKMNLTYLTSFCTLLPRASIQNDCFSFSSQYRHGLPNLWCVCLFVCFVFFWDNALADCVSSMFSRLLIWSHGHIYTIAFSHGQNSLYPSVLPNPCIADCILSLGKTRQLPWWVGERKQSRRVAGPGLETPVKERIES